MKIDDKIIKMKNLVEELNAASEKYYGCGDSDMSDAAWDRGYNELIKMENSLSAHYKNSPAHTVGFVSKDAGELIYE